MIKITLLLALLLSIGTSVSAQEVSVPVKGIVKDEFGRPLAGVRINSRDGETGISTNANGEYALILDVNSPLIFSYAGYSTQKIAVNGKAQIDVELKPDIHKKDEVVQLGYTSQLRHEISGSVATVTGEELEKSPVANLTQSFAGRFAGLVTQETYSELSRATTNIYVRGLSAARGNGPLVIIDGIICAYNSNQTLEYISANEIGICNRAKRCIYASSLWYSRCKWINRDYYQTWNKR
nr:carboxypeptidase-like regulatory domain-containing protein [Pedobacter panaciterrae]